MKIAILTLLAAASLCIGHSAFANETVMLPAQQNNCKNLNVKKNPVQNEKSGSKVSVMKPDLKKAAEASERPIDLIICLDTSNSMDGLIGSAKQKIWDIVNELAAAKPKPHVRVGIYAYGTPSFGAESGFVRKEIDLSDDLDTVFTRLTALSTNGGDEYCARVISTAANEQSWSKDKNALKIIVVAGNEPATQDPKLDVFETARRAIAHGIIVDTIYCGSPATPEASAWREVAHTADGQFAAIDQDRGTVTVSTPYDKKLAELSGRINNTYLAYGKDGAQGQAQQSEADSMSQSLGAANYASRAAAKSSGQYRNSSWDLVDAVKQKAFSWSKLQKEELPSEMQKMSPAEQKTFLEKKATERAEIQKQIAELSVQRAKYIQEELKKSAKPSDKGFDSAMLGALREQAKRKGFAFDAK